MKVRVAEDDHSDTEESLLNKKHGVVLQPSRSGVSSVHSNETNMINIYQ
jgi:hypothetical protein